MQKNRLPTYLAAAGVALVAIVVTGVRYTSLLPFAVVLVCPLIMFFMMKRMGCMGGTDKKDHRGHGSEHDPTDKVEAPSHQS